MSDDFDGPGSTSGIEWKDVENHLLLITPLSREEMDTSFGAAKPVRANITDLDDNEEYPDVLIFPRVLCSQVAGNIGSGRKNLGRVGKGQAKKGQSAPWILGDPTDADKSIARAYLSQNLANAPF